MKRFPLVPMDMPTTYRIRILGVLESSWAQRLWGMKANRVESSGEQETTELVGEVIDQAALVGIINALYNSGHTVVSVERLLPAADHPPSEANTEV